MTETTEYLKLYLKNGDFIAYHKFTPSTKTHHPTVIFLGGFKSDMSGTKAIFLEDFCVERGIPFIRFDYQGHGESSGDFLDGSIGRWRDDAVSIIDEATDSDEKIILIGSSLGGWIMLLAALARPERIESLIGIAPAPDFTENLIWDKLKKEEQNIIMNEGVYNLPSEYCDSPDVEPEPYPITKKLIIDARDHLLLHDEIKLDCKIDLIHGMKDFDVPYEISIKISEKVTSDNVTIYYQKNGDHRMSSPESLKLIKNVLIDALAL